MTDLKAAFRPCYPTNILLHQLFSLQAAASPEAVALFSEERHYSYRQLDEASDALAARLQAAGVGPGALVASLGSRSPETVIGTLAILKAGGAYLPLELSHPKGRLQLIVDEAKPALLLAQKEAKDKWPTGLPVVGLEERASSRPIKVDLSPESLAYVFYTSGSTGQPKGVMIPHRAVCSFLLGLQAVYGLKVTDRFLQRSPLSFDPAIRELFWPLIMGASVVLVRPGFEADPGYLISLINRLEVSAMNMVPSLLTLFLEHRNAGSCRSLKRLFCVGETLPPSVVGRFFTLLAGCTLYNAYGPTETTGFSLSWTCRPQDAELTIVPIGLPHPNVKLYILNETLEPVSPGVLGEIYIGGPKLAHGYLHRDDLTLKSFVPNPFGEGKLYKTGDLATYRFDGAIEFHGRIDHQVKLRGQRVELGEIDAVLRKHPAVRNCYVVAHEERLVAYVVSSSSVSAEALREHAKEMLPAYMVPLVIFLEELPLTPNGKVDRQKLPRPDKSTARYCPPRTVLETQLVGIWEKVLAHAPIGIEDNFFTELGCDSLQAVRLFCVIDHELGLRLPIATLFSAPTIEKLAAGIEAERTLKNSNSRWQPLVTIKASGSRPPFFGIHGADGNVLFYRRFSELLGPEQPFYALQSPGLDGSEITRTQVESIAAYYLEEIRQVQPRGPYLLGGYSFGGLVSYEIACLLAAQGEAIAALLLFDTANPANPPRARNWFNVMAKRIPRLFKRGISWEIVFEYFAHRFRGKLGIRFLAFKERFMHPGPEQVVALKIRQVLRQAALEYRPRPYPGKVTLFTILDQPLDFEPQPDLGWSPLAIGGVEIHEVSGSHATLFWDEAVVQVLAGRVEQSISASLK